MKKVVLCMTLVFVGKGYAKKNDSLKSETHVLTKKYKRGRPFDSFYKQRIRRYIQDIGCDSYYTLSNFWSFSSLKVATGMLPLYLIGRRADAAVHRQFYDIETHTNKNQPPKFLKDIALDDKYISIPFAILGFISIAHHDPFKRRRAQVFITGLAWAYAIKCSVKLFKTDANLRPWHENYNRHKRSHGGNPSGHMTITTYMATFWGCQEGVRLGLPLGLFAAFAFTMNISSNHHYFSQAVAGTGLGLALGIAASKTFDSLIEPISNKVSFGVGITPHGGWRLKLAYDF